MMTASEPISYPGWGTVIEPPPPKMRELRDTYAGVADNLPWLDTAANQVADFVLREQLDEPATSDGKRWRVAYMYDSVHYAGQLAIFFAEKDESGQYPLPILFVRGFGKDVRKHVEQFIIDLAVSIED